MSDNPQNQNPAEQSESYDNLGYMPDEKTFKARLDKRNRRGRVGQVFFLLSLIVGFIALITLFINVINEAFGTIAVEDEKPVPQLIEDLNLEGDELADLSEADLLTILAEEAAGGLRLIIRDNLSVVEPSEFTQRPVSEVLNGLSYPEDVADQQFTSDFPEETMQQILLDNLSRGQLEDIVLDKVVGRSVVNSWPLIPTIFNWELDPAVAEEIAEIETQIGPAEEDVQRLESEVNSLESRLEGLPPEADGIAQLRSDFQQAQTELDNAEDRLENLQEDRARLIRTSILAERNEFHPEAELIRYYSWLNADFLTTPMNSIPANAGIRTAILGSIYMMLLVVLVSVPVGVGAAIYLNEYATDSFVNRIIETNVRNLAGVPSIIYGLLGLAIFVRALIDITNGRTIISGALTLSLLILPVIITAAQEALRSVSDTLREASYGLGATKWQTISRVILPDAIPGILTGVIIAISRAVGETAPLIVVGAASFVLFDPTLTSRFTVLPSQIYQWTARPQAQFRDIAAAAIIVLLILNLSLTSIAIILRNRYSRER